MIGRLQIIKINNMLVSVEVETKEAVLAHTHTHMGVFSIRSIPFSLPLFNDTSFIFILCFKNYFSLYFC